MNVFVDKKQDYGYAFAVIEEKGDPDGMDFRSDRDYFLVSGIKPVYPTYAHAHATALQIAEKYPEIVMAKKASFLSDGEPIERFFKEWESLSLNNSKSRKLYASSTFSVSKLSNNLVKTASVKVEENDSDEQRKIDCLRFFAETASIALSPVHETARLFTAEYLPSSDSYNVIIGDAGGELCCAKFDKRLLLGDVIPCGRIVKETPFHSKDFFERYVEPIMHSAGHIYLPDETIAIVNHPSSKRRKMFGFNLADKTSRWIKLDLPTEEDSIWSFKVEPVILSTASLKNKQVKCIRPDLPSYYGRTGDVTEEIDRGTYKDVVVDFRRGLGIVVMTDADVELFDA